MIYLIGGAPRVGKSILGKRLAAESGAFYLSVDDLRDEVKEALPEERRKEAFPWPAFAGNSLKNTTSPEERIQIQCVESASLQTEIEKRVLEATQTDRSLVIEGILLLPALIRKLEDLYPGRVRSIVVGLHDAELFYQGVIKDADPNNWLRETERLALQQIAEFVLAFSEFLKVECAKYGITYFERTSNFNQNLDVLTQVMTS
jgi:2-phosphoglycerate kinase